MFDEFVEFLKAAVAINTVCSDAAEGAPFGEANRKCLELVLNKAGDLGFEVKNGGGYYGYAHIEGSEDKSVYGILGHLDVVPFGNGWTHNPLGEIDGGVFYGRGVMDDKGPLLACLYAAAELIKTRGAPKRSLRFIVGCDEEGGKWRCMKAYAENEVQPATGFTPDGDFPVINCEKHIVHLNITLPLPAEFEEIYGGDRVNMVMDRCTVLLKNGVKKVFEGKSAHASHPEQGINAFLKSLFVLDLPYTLALFNAFKDGSGGGLNIGFGDVESGLLTQNVGTVKTVGGKMVIQLDLRVPVSAKPTEVIERVKTALSAISGEAVGIEIEDLQRSVYFPKNHPLVQSLLSVYNDVTGERAAPLAIGGGTYAKAMTEGVAFGPEFASLPSTIHQPDERVSLKTLRLIYNIYQEAIKRACW